MHSVADPLLTRPRAGRETRLLIQSQICIWTNDPNTINGFSRKTLRLVYSSLFSISPFIHIFTILYCWE
jgi:hypothetical protein